MACWGCLRGAVGLAVASVVLGACADSHQAAAVPGGARSHSTPAVTPPPAATSRATSSTPKAHQTHRPYSDVNPPPRRAGDFVVTVLVVTNLDPRDDGHPPRRHRPRQEFWGEEVRTCVNPSSRHHETVGWKDWRAEGMDGRVYAADPHGSQPLRTPTYPVRKVLSPGQCVTGYWLITVPKGSDIRAIQFAPEDGPVLIEWLTLR